MLDEAPSREAAASDADRTEQTHDDPSTIVVRERALIEEVSFEPTSPCRQGDVVVRVSLRPEAWDAKVFVDHRPNNPAVMRFATSGTHRVAVLARDWRDGIEQRDVAIDVRDCEAPDVLELSAARLSNDVVLFRTVQPVPRDGVVTWDFGDGTAERTSAGTVEHDFSLRSQEAPQHTFLVQATVRAPGSPTARATIAVSFVNYHYIAAAAGYAILPARYDRFAFGTHELLERTVEVRNILPVSVHFETATLEAYDCATMTASARVLEAREVGIRGDLPAGEVVTVPLSVPLDLWAVPPCRVAVRLSGVAGDGRDADVATVFELGVPEESVQITDPALLDEIAAARALTGHDDVTVDDLVRLRATDGVGPEVEGR